MNQQEFKNIVESAKNFNTGSLADPWQYRFEKLVEYVNDQLMTESGMTQAQKDLERIARRNSGFKGGRA